MAKRYEVKESLRKPGTFYVMDTQKRIAVKMGLPEDSAHEMADKLNLMFPVKVS